MLDSICCVICVWLEMGNVQTSFSSESPLEQALSPLVEGFSHHLLVKGLKMGQFMFLCNLCQEVLDKTPGGHDYVWPLRDCDHLVVWDELSPTENNWRFVVYIVWLKKQPESFVKFCNLRKERKEGFDTCLKNLIDHTKNDERLQTQTERSGAV